MGYQRRVHGGSRSRCTVVELEMSFSHIAVLIYGTILLSVSFAVPIEDVAPLEEIPSTGGDHVLAALQESWGKPCCRAKSARCLACSRGVSVKEFCKTSPGKYGCPKTRRRHTRGRRRRSWG